MQRSDGMDIPNLRRNLPTPEDRSVIPASATGGARQFAETLERIETSRGSTVNQARRRIANKVRVGIGTFENIVRDRVKRVDERIRERLYALLVRELESEIGRLTHELEMVRQCGDDIGAEHVRQIETHLAAAKNLLSGGRTRA